MLSPQQLRTWIASTKAIILNNIDSDNSLDDGKKEILRNEYISALTNLQESCDDYFTNMKKAPLGEAVVSILSYLNFTPIEIASEKANLRKFFSCDNIFNKDFTNMDVKTSFLTNKGLDKIEMLIDDIKEGADKDISNLCSCISDMKTASLPTILEIPSKKPPVYRLDMQETGRVIYNLLGAYDIIKDFGFNLFIPSYIEEERA